MLAFAACFLGLTPPVQAKPNPAVAAKAAALPEELGVVKLDFNAETPLRSMLIDLRNVAGYEASCLRPAAQFLREAPQLGLTRIALVATSSVMRTASQLAASSLRVELRMFEHEPHATQWLQGSPA